MKAEKKWCLAFFVIVILLLAGLGSLTVIVDPFFHYHAPLEGLQYPIDNERYQNDGIVKHFAYDAVITGMSTAENFKASEFDELFQTHSIKVPYSAGSFREINDNLLRAIEANPGIRYVLRGIDCGRLFEQKDSLSYDDLPVYLYDRKLYNDVYYVFNKEVLFGNVSAVFDYTKSGKRTTDFDAYCNWSQWYEYGEEAVESAYARKEGGKLAMAQMTDEEYEAVCGNVTQNIVETAKANPNITFLLYFSPSSIYQWDEWMQWGTLKTQIEGQKTATRLLLECDNVELYSFFDEYGMICDPGNYKDRLHFSEDINSWILRRIKTGEHRLTEDNYEDYYENIENFYLNYDYEALFAD